MLVPHVHQLAQTVRVLHHFCTAYGMTGVETFVLQLCAAQLRLGHQPEISGTMAVRPELVDAATTAGVPIHAAPERDGLEARLPRKLGSARFLFRSVGSLARLLRSRSHDVLHLHAVGVSGLDAMVAGALAGKPVVVTHHTTLTCYPIERLAQRLTFGLERRLARRVVMPYAAAAAELVAAGVPADRVRVVPFCVDEARFSADAVRRAPGDPFRVVMLARVVEGKGHRELLAAAARMKDHLPSLRLRIIGDGPLRPELEALGERLGLADRVEWLGKVSHADVPGLLAEGDLVVLPSHMEGETFPVSLIEGMALGLPAVGSRWFGIPDVIGDDGAGAVVEPGDVDALAGAMTRFGQPAAYAQASAAALARVRQQFTGRAVAEEYARLYGEALRGKGR